MHRQQYVVANWKMHGSCAELELRLQPLCNAPADLQQSTKIIVCPPDIHIMKTAAICENSAVDVGAQNLSRHNPYGAYTGEVSAHMLQDAGCSYVIVGHSERRVMHRESNEIVAEKFAAAMAHKLTPILCVGEHQSERRSGDTERVIGLQLRTVFARITKDNLQSSPWLVAYEPVWAIGSGNSASPEDVESVHSFIRQQIDKYTDANSDNIPILYGGSIKPDNASSLFTIHNVDGGLVGSSSLDTEQFIAICKSTGA